MMFFFILLLVIGLIYAAVSVADSLLCREPGDDKAYIVMPVRGHVEDIELRVRGAVRMARRMGAGVILADFGTDGETEEICRRLCREFGSVEFAAAAELTERMMRDHFFAES